MTNQRQVGGFWRLLGFVTEAIALVGLYAFIYRVALGKGWFWMVFFFVVLGYTLWSMRDVFITDPTFVLSIAFWISLLVVTLVLLVPQLVALFLYAFRSNELWAGSQEKP